jgi:hypothetical protein
MNWGRIWVDLSGVLGEVAKGTDALLIIRIGLLKANPYKVTQSGPKNWYMLASNN